MKKVCILLILIFAISFVSAIDISLGKTSYNTRETIQAEISGGFIDNLIPENIAIYKEGSVHSSGDLVNFIKYNDKYYVYAIAPASAGKYFLRIQNTKHYVGTKESSETVEQSFTVTESNASYLSFSPGVIYTPADFSIDITAYNQNQDITVEFSEAGFKQTFSLGYNQVKTVYISIANITNTTVSSIKVGSYSIPAIIITNKAPVVNVSEANVSEVNASEQIILENFFDITVTEINDTMLVDQENLHEIRLNPVDEELLDNLEVSSSNENIVVSISPQQTVLIVTIIAEEEFSGFINLSIPGSSIIIPVYVYITENASEVDYSSPPIPQTCSQMNGNYCLEGETCSALQKTDSMGNLCCIGDCNSSSSMGSKWFWIILIVLILGAGGWFLYKKSKEGTDFKALATNLISKRSNDYTKRIEPTPKEVRSGLTKT